MLQRSEEGIAMASDDRIPLFPGQRGSRPVSGGSCERRVVIPFHHDEGHVQPGNLEPADQISRAKGQLRWRRCHHLTFQRPRGSLLKRRRLPQTDHDRCETDAADHDEQLREQDKEPHDDSRGPLVCKSYAAHSRNLCLTRSIESPSIVITWEGSDRRAGTMMARSLQPHVIITSVFWR